MYSGNDSYLPLIRSGLLIAILTILVVCLPRVSHAQEWVVDGPPAGGLYYAVFNPHHPDEVYGISHNMNPCQSHDGGYTWRDASDLFAVSPGSAPTFRLLFHPTNDDTVYMNLEGTLFRSVNGMDDWETVTDLLEYSNIPNIFMSPANPSRIYGITSMEDPEELEMIRSNNGGDTWETVRPDSLSFLVDVDPFNADRIIGFYDGYIVISTDGGDRFHRQDGITNHAFYEYDYPPIQFDHQRPDTLYLYDPPNIFCVSLAFPITVTPIYTTGNTLKIEINAANHLQLIDHTEPYEEVVLRSRDAGATWDTLGATLPHSNYYPPAPDIRRLHAFAQGIDSETYLLTNERNTFLSLDGGRTYDATCNGLDTPKITALEPIVPGDDLLFAQTDESNQLWIGGLDEQWRCLLWENNKGTAFSPLAPDSFFFWDDQLYRTPNLGLDVQQIPVPRTTHAVDMVGVLASDPSVIFLRQQGRIYRSDDFGDTWNWLENAMPVVDEIGPFASDTTLPDRIYTWSERLQYSEDRGQTWETLGPDAQRPIKLVTEPWGWGVFGVGENGDLWYQNQYGTFIDVTNSDDLPDNAFVVDIAIRPHTMHDLYAALGSRGIWHTEDFGETWSQVDIVPQGECTSLTFNQHGTGLYVGHESGLIFADNLFIQAGLGNTIPRQIPQQIQLYPAYPNPFNASTRISYNLPEASWVKVAVYDMLGRRVTRLMNGFQNAGQHNLAWQATSSAGLPVASGVYLVRLETNGVQQTQRIQLVK